METGLITNMAKDMNINLTEGLIEKKSMNKAMVCKCFDLFDLSKTEIRGISKVDGHSRIISGWFSSVEYLLSSLEVLESEPWQWYFVFNEVEQTQLISKSNMNMNYNCFTQSNVTLSDKDVLRRRWIMIDIDPVRPSGVSSSEEELAEALSVADKVRDFLTDKGFHTPLVALSGSGYHLMYPCSIELSQESDGVMKDFLSVLAMLFNTERVEIDTVVHNRSRLTKLYGTVAKKGLDSLQRPWRVSNILSMPESLEKVDFLFVKKLVDDYMDCNKPRSEYNDYGRKRFDVRTFLSKHGIGYKEKRVKGGVRFVLNSCVFNPEHKTPDAAVFQFDDGRLGYKCFHNSCSNYHWKEFRERLEPLSEPKPSYSSSDYNSFEQLSPDFEEQWLRLKDINALNAEQVLHIPTGFRGLDSRLNGGLAAGGITILTGANGCGKTVFLNNLILNACDKGFKIGLWSGEMQSWRIKNWIHLIARGVHSDKPEIGRMIDDWLQERLFIYNNNYGNNWEELFVSIRNLVLQQSVNLVVLDNLAYMNINRNIEDKYEQQSMFVKALAEYAKQSAIHIILVAHPRKSFGVVRKHDISGSYDLSNMADNVFIMHKVNDDFMKGAKEFWKSSTVEGYSKFDSLIEVAKNRDMGEEGMIGLFYERYSKRLKCEFAEILHYSWEQKELIPAI